MQTVSNHYFWRLYRFDMTGLDFAAQQCYPLLLSGCELSPLLTRRTAVSRTELCVRCVNVVVVLSSGTTACLSKCSSAKVYTHKGRFAFGRFSTCCTRCCGPEGLHNPTDLPGFHCAILEQALMHETVLAREGLLPRLLRQSGA